MYDKTAYFRQRQNPVLAESPCLQVLAGVKRDIALQKDRVLIGKIESCPPNFEGLRKEADLCDATILLDRGRLEFYFDCAMEPLAVSPIKLSWQTRAGVCCRCREVHALCVLPDWGSEFYDTVRVQNQRASPERWLPSCDAVGQKYTQDVEIFFVEALTVDYYR